MTLLGLSIAPWVLETAALSILVVAFFLYIGARERERNEREAFERRMRGGR